MIQYHSDPLLFYHMLASLVAWDDRQLGFDSTAFLPPGQNEVHIRTSDGVEYAFEETLLRAYTP